MKKYYPIDLSLKSRDYFFNSKIKFFNEFDSDNFSKFQNEIIDILIKTSINGVEKVDGWYGIKIFHKGLEEGLIETEEKVGHTDQYKKTIKRNISECIKFANICSGEIIQNYGAKFDNLNDYQSI